MKHGDSIGGKYRKEERYNNIVRRSITGQLEPEGK